MNTTQRAMLIRERPTTRCPRTSVRGLHARGRSFREKPPAEAWGCPPHGYTCNSDRTFSSSFFVARIPSGSDSPFPSYSTPTQPR